MRRIILAILTLTLLMSNMAYASETKFQDINGHWGETYIRYMIDNGISEGYPDGSWKPNGTIRVDEFLTLCVKSIPNVTIENNGQSTYWATPFIQYALDEQIIGANEFTNFERAITREEMALIAVRTLSKTKVVPQVPDTQLISSINDYHLIDDYYKQDVLDSYAMGLITGKPNNLFDPKGTATRAESAVVVVRLLEEDERQPFEVADIPSTTAYYTTWTDLGWQEVPIVFYAPLDSNGVPVADPIDVYNHFAEIVEDTDNYVENNYNPHSNVSTVSLYPDDEYQHISEYQTAVEKLVDIMLFVDLRMIETDYDPYSINFWDMTLSSKDVEEMYGEYMNYLYTYFFEEDAQMIKSRVDYHLDRMSGGDHTSVDEEYVLNNGRELHIGSGVGMKLSFSKKK